jgi:hypothetical protein
MRWSRVFLGLGHVSNGTCKEIAQATYSKCFNEAVECREADRVRVH